MFLLALSSANNDQISRLKLWKLNLTCFTMILAPKPLLAILSLKHSRWAQRLEVINYALLKRNGLPWHHTAGRYLKYVYQRALTLCTKKYDVELLTLTPKLVKNLL